MLVLVVDDTKEALRSNYSEPQCADEAAHRTASPQRGAGLPTAPALAPGAASAACLSLEEHTRNGWRKVPYFVADGLRGNVCLGPEQEERQHYVNGL